MKNDDSKAMPQNEAVRKRYRANEQCDQLATAEVMKIKEEHTSEQLEALLANFLDAQNTEKTSDFSLITFLSFP